VKRATAAIAALAFLLIAGCRDQQAGVDDNHTFAAEQQHTEQNQQSLMAKQPPPNVDWSLERDNLTKRFKLMNDRAINFYMYVFIEGVAEPIGYYQVNKVSSVDSQLTNTQQIVDACRGCGHYEHMAIPSPSEDGSYGTNGQGVFGFTPEDIYIEHNMHYLVSSVPLQFAHPVARLAIINTDEARKAQAATRSVIGGQQ
jgi:hypothetical protein